MRVVAASLRLPRELAELGDKEVRARVECERLAIRGTGVEARVEGELGMLDLSPGDLRWLTSDSAWNPRRPGSESSHGVGPGHLLQDGDEGANLHLGKS